MQEFILKNFMSGGLFPGFRQFAQVVDYQRCARMRSNDLNETAFNVGKGRPQNFVTTNNFI